MLAIILSILKIIGIVLLAILGIVLFMVILILFVPIRYRLDALVPETEFDKGFDVEKISASARFSWFIHIVSGGIDYPEKKEFYVKLFGIKIIPSGKKQKEKENSKKNDNDISSDNDEKEIDDKIEEKEDSEKLSYVEKSEMDGAKSEDNEKEPDDTTEKEETSDIKNEESRAFIEIITDFFEKVEHIIKTPQDVLQKMQYTISRVCGKIEMIKSTLENDIFKRAFALCKKKIIRMLKMILPDKTDIELMLGTGDPADTAGVMAFYGALYPFLYDKVRFDPDFERSVVKADVHLKGHITVFVILYCLLVCYFNKDVKKVIRRFKKIINS